MLSSIHSHSGMGGYLQHTLYELSVFGWIEETVVPMVNGIAQSIIQAHKNLQEGTLSLAQGELLNTNINRSPQSYLQNPPEERGRYKYDVDKMMTVLGFKTKAGDDVGLVSWFPVHGVSVNNTNRLINGDNKGYAAYLAEKLMKPSFVAAFAQSNEGDVSPNTMGAFCTGTNIACDGSKTMPCPQGSVCHGRGPGWESSDLESNRIIGQNQAYKALELYNQASVLENGPLDYVQLFWDITNTSVDYQHGHHTKTCLPAMGYAFAAGTTDGPALDGFYQNTTQGTFFWDTVKNIVRRPTLQQALCQLPKPILLDTGEMHILPHTWQPEILDIQLFRIGQVFIYAVPSEFTTMSGRRLKHAIHQALIKHGLGTQETVVIHSGPANGYASYCATFEEYQHQRYEGASTPYGPHTLQAYIEAFEKLVQKMADPNFRLNQSKPLPDFTHRTFNFAPPYRSDQPHLFRSFGDILRDVTDTFFYADSNPVISARFVAGNPRNDPMIGKTFLTVEKKSGNTWKVVRTDNDYDTRFYWHYKHPLLGMSEARIEWHVDSSVEHGIYRLGYFGHSRASFSK
ncbi:Neutral/alkaline nonlysosomal ceramidase [Sporodiniella umbellata]|nr:Neutral/alkaline nonlysosomal ceramidase [Sporodiniella umbellata]